MSSYIRSIATDIKYAILAVIVAVQRFFAGQELVRLENSEITLRSRIRRLETDNSTLSSRNRDFQRALDGRNSRANEQALISGRTKFGAVTSDTATTFSEVYLPAHDVTIKVTDDDFTITFENDAVDHEYVEYDTDGLEETGQFRKITFNRV